VASIPPTHACRQVMAKSQGRVNPALMNQILARKLKG
jgi:Asp-tRNA(Asn)/Glu-tRNA(Gln) amidotransferase B subunit